MKPQEHMSEKDFHYLHLKTEDLQLGFENGPWIECEVPIFYSNFLVLGTELFAF